MTLIAAAAACPAGRRCKKQRNIEQRQHEKPPAEVGNITITPINRRRNSAITCCCTTATDDTDARARRARRRVGLLQKRRYCCHRHLKIGFPSPSSSYIIAPPDTTSYEEWTDLLLSPAWIIVAWWWRPVQHAQSTTTGTILSSCSAMAATVTQWRRETDVAEVACTIQGGHARSFLQNANR